MKKNPTEIILWYLLYVAISAFMWWAAAHIVEYFDMSFVQFGIIWGMILGIFQIKKYFK